MSLRKHRAEAKKAGYRSKFEHTIAQWLEEAEINFEYEPCKLEYIVPESKHRYTPDWKIGKIFFESKGKLTATDRKKILHVLSSNPSVDIRIIFQNADVKLNKGSPTTYGMWATKHGIKWYDWRKDKNWLKAKSIK